MTTAAEQTTTNRAPTPSLQLLHLQFSTFSTGRQCDNDNGKYYKYVCITINQLPHTECNPNITRPNRNPTTKQHAVVNIQLKCSYMSYTYPRVFDTMLMHRSYYSTLSLSRCRL